MSSPVVDVRVPVAILAQAIGLLQTVCGHPTATHALGNGIMGSWLASVAVNAGQTLASKRRHA